MTVPDIFDFKAVRRHRNRAARRQHTVTPILDAAAGILLDRLDDVARQFTSALDIGGRGLIATALAERNIPVVSLDSAPDQARQAPPPALCTDMDTLPFAPHSFDLVIANLALHWVNDLPGIFSQIRHVLRPDGLFLASMPILPTLRPLRNALDNAELALCDGVSPRVSPLPTQQSCVTLLQRAGFALPVVDHESLDLRYRSLRALMADLRAAGENNALTLRTRTTAPRMLFAAAAAELESNAEGHFAMPLHMAILSGWSPDPSQPKAATPGQFDTNLNDVFTPTSPKG